jgi:hypothetical protein
MKGSPRRVKVLLLDFRKISGVRFQMSAAGKSQIANSKSQTNLNDPNTKLQTGLKVVWLSLKINMRSFITKAQKFKNTRK